MLVRDTHGQAGLGVDRHEQDVALVQRRDHLSQSLAGVPLLGLRVPGTCQQVVEFLKRAGARLFRFG